MKYYICSHNYLVKLTKCSLIYQTPMSSFSSEHIHFGSNSLYAQMTNAFPMILHLFSQKKLDLHFHRGRCNSLLFVNVRKASKKYSNMQKINYRSVLIVPPIRKHFFWTEEFVELTADQTFTKSRLQVNPRLHSLNHVHVIPSIMSNKKRVTLKIQI